MSDTGQNAGWKTSHRRICKEYNRFMVSNDWQALDAHRRTDSILLSHLMVPMSTSSEYANAWISGSRDLDRMVESPAGCLMDLMSNPTIVSLPYMGSRELDAVATSLVRKFARNNFLLHSHLNPAYAHGAYPLASRALNHSCVPNAAPRFVLQEGETPRMDVVALSKITKGEEVRYIVVGHF